MSVKEIHKQKKETKARRSKLTSNALLVFIVNIYGENDHFSHVGEVVGG